MQSAAKGWSEPILTDAAEFTDGRNTNQSRHSTPNVHVRLWIAHIFILLQVLGFVACSTFLCFDRALSCFVLLFARPWAQAKPSRLQIGRLPWGSLTDSGSRSLYV